MIVNSIVVTLGGSLLLSRGGVCIFEQFDMKSKKTMASLQQGNVVPSS